MPPALLINTSMRGVRALTSSASRRTSASEPKSACRNSIAEFPLRVRSSATARAPFSGSRP